VLDPIKCLERIESELNATVIASNPAMFWYVLSKIGRNYPMNGYGRLLLEWPAIKDERNSRRSKSLNCLRTPIRAGERFVPREGLPARP